MTNFEAKQFLANYEEVTQGLKGREFVLALYDNAEQIESKLKGLYKINKPSKKFLEIQEQISTKYRELADRDPQKNGEPKTRPVMLPDGTRAEQYIITIQSNLEKAHKFIEQLRKENLELFKEQEQKDQEYKIGRAHV